MTYMKLIYFVSMLLVVNGKEEDVFDSRCDVNNTLFVQKGRHATFIAHHTDYEIILFRSTPSQSVLLDAIMYSPDTPLVLDRDYRVNFTITESDVIITLYNVTMDDYGIYNNLEIPRRCWELLVLDVWNPQNITTFEENLPAYIDATPRASSMIRPRVNATATWLLDGLIVSQRADFIEQDGRMIIMRMPRYLNAKNVTYRITEDNGDVHDLNLTLWVLYGPYSPLQFSPSRTSYIVTSGDVLPDITCSTDCNPPCEITWDRSGIRNVLSLGKVDKLSKGMYTCRATRNGTDRVVERSLYVEVNDETSFIIAVTILGTMHGITLVLLCVCTLCWYRTTCSKGAIERTVEKTQNRTTTEQVQEANISAIEMEHYEGLDRSRNTGVQQTYESLE